MNDRTINNLSRILFYISRNEPAQRILDGILWHLGTDEYIGGYWLDGMLDALWYALDLTIEDVHMSKSFFINTLRGELTDEAID